MINVALDIDILEGISRENYMNEEELLKFITYIVSEELNGKKIEYVSLTITNNEEIRNINREYRNIDRETDVISFAYQDNEDVDNEFEVLGDIIISIDKVKEQAKEYNHSEKREFYYLVCHSILHLLGYDHINEEEKKIMREKEEKYLSNFEIQRE